MTNLTAELETDVKRFLTSAVSFNYLKNSFEFSFLLDKSQLQILLKCLKIDRVFYLLFLPLEFFFNVMMFQLRAESTGSTAG